MKIVINQILMKPLYTKLIFMYQMFEIFMVNYFRALCGLITEVFQHDKDGIEYYSQLIKPLLYDSEEGEALHEIFMCLNCNSNFLLYDFCHMI